MISKLKKKTISSPEFFNVWRCEENCSLSKYWTFVLDFVNLNFVKRIYLFIGIFPNAWRIASSFLVNCKFEIITFSYSHW